MRCFVFIGLCFTENLNIVSIENWLWKQENLCLIRLHSHVVNRTKGTKLVEYFKTQQKSLQISYAKILENAPQVREIKKIIKNLKSNTVGQLHHCSEHPETRDHVQTTDVGTIQAHETTLKSYWIASGKHI